MSEWISRPKHDEETGRLVDAGSVRCRCGSRHELSMYNDSDCRNCGTEFNSFGQELAPREQWQEYEVE